MRINVPTGRCKECKKAYPITRKGRTFCSDRCKNTFWVRADRKQKREGKNHD